MGIEIINMIDYALYSIANWWLFFLTSHRIQPIVIVGIWCNNTTRIYVMLRIWWSFIYLHKIYLMLGIQWNNITQNLFNAKNLLKCNITKINLMLKSDKKKSHRIYWYLMNKWNNITQILPNVRNLMK